MSNLAYSDDVFILELLKYTQQQDGATEIYFLELSTLQALRVFPMELPIEILELEIYRDDEPIPPDEHPAIGTVKQFFKYLDELNEEYVIGNIFITIGGIVSLVSHDDSEVILRFPEGSSFEPLVAEIISQRGLSAAKVLDHMQKHKGKYVLISKPSKFVRTYEEFDDYLEDRKD